MDLLLLHGALGSRRQMRSLQNRLGGRSIDLTGHGEREIPVGGLSFDHFLGDIDAALQGIDKAHLFGYSMGGYAAMLYAARFPEKVLSVATVGTKYMWTPEGLEKELRRLDPDAMEAKVPAFARMLAETHGVDRWRRLIAAIAASMSELATAPLLAHEVVDRIRCPVLLCVGELDTTAVPEDTHVFARAVRNAEVVVLPGTRHPFEEVDLDALVALLDRFWQQAVVLP